MPHDAKHNTDDYEDDDTINSRPVPRRLRWGWQAWESTSGYIARTQNPNAALKLQLYMFEKHLTYTATFSWGNMHEDVRFKPSLGQALTNLWSQIAHHHTIFQSQEDVYRSPIGYGDDEWLDEPTTDIFYRLVHIIQQLFISDWLLIIVYRPVEQPNHRLQIRLLAQSNQLQRATHAATLRDACRAMLHQCALIFTERNE